MDGFMDKLGFPFSAEDERARVFHQLNASGDGGLDRPAGVQASLSDEEVP